MERRAARGLRGPYRREARGLPAWTEAAAAWVLAYLAFGVAEALTVGAGLETGRVLGFSSQRSVMAGVTQAVLWGIPFVPLVYRWRATWFAICSVLAPLIVLYPRLVVIYCQSELARTKVVWWWPLKDLAFWPVTFALGVLGAYVARRFVHAYIHHPSLAPTWGGSRVPKAADKTPDAGARVARGRDLTS
jgi:hypothetical protein